MKKEQLDIDTRDELDKLDSLQAKERIFQALEAKRQVKEELDANPQYQALKENLKAISEGKRETDKRQNSIIKYLLEKLNNNA